MSKISLNTNKISTTVKNYKSLLPAFFLNRQVKSADKKIHIQTSTPFVTLCIDRAKLDALRPKTVSAPKPVLSAEPQPGDSLESYIRGLMIHTCIEEQITNAYRDKTIPLQMFYENIAKRCLKKLQEQSDQSAFGIKAELTAIIYDTVWTMSGSDFQINRADAFQIFLKHGGLALINELQTACEKEPQALS